MEASMEYSRKALVYTWWVELQRQIFSFYGCYTSLGLYGLELKDLGLYLHIMEGSHTLSNIFEAFIDILKLFDISDKVNISQKPLKYFDLNKTYNVSVFRSYNGFSFKQWNVHTTVRL